LGPHKPLFVGYSLTSGWAAAVSRIVHDGFTERFKLALSEAGLAGHKQKDLGRLFGVSAQAVKKWLNGESIPTAERAPRIAETLGVRRAWLLDNEQPMRALQGAITEAAQEYQPTSAISLSGAEFRLLTHFRQLPRQLQQDLASLLAGMCELRIKKADRG